MDKSAAILIVDDYLLIRNAVKSVLTQLGFHNIHQADNGKTAQDLMGKQKIEIVIGDWGMPIMSGLDLLKWMRGTDEYGRVPFMMLTAESNPGSVRLALQSGVNAYMVKPFTVHSFASKFMAMIGPVRDTAQAPPAALTAPEPDAPPPRVIGLDAPMSERIRQSTVLIVDDIPTNIEVLAGALKDEYNVKVAINGKKALEIVNAFHIDLILLDIMMPGMDGFEVCRILKGDPATAAIPIIFLSARDGVDDVVSGLKLGAVDYVSKPADPTILKARLSTHLTLSAAMHDLKRQNRLLTENAHLREDVEHMTRHDLKSPIAVALQGSQALLAEPLSEQQRERVEIIEMAANNALEMINRTLDVYKMEAGTYEPTLAPFDLGALVQRVTAQTALAFEWKKLKLAFAQPEGAVCLGEPLLCYSLFTNLLKNAAEASSTGDSVTITLTPGLGNLAVAVTNEGEVPAALKDRFFEKYATVGKPGGSGLGTYSVKLMAEVQGGTVRMETGGGQTKVVVALPAG